MTTEDHLNTSETVYTVRSESGNTGISDHHYLYQERCPAIISEFTDFLFENGKIELLEVRG